MSKLVGHSTLYAAGQVLLLGAGILSFPILTRYLTIEEYGILTLVNASLDYLIAIAKGGLPAALIRLHSGNGVAYTTDQGKSNFLTLTTGIVVQSTIAAILYALIVNQFFSKLEPIFLTALLIGTVAIIVRSVSTFSTKIYQARHEPLGYLYSSLALRFSAIILSVSLLLFTDFGLLGYLSGFVAAEIISTFFIVAILFKKFRPARRHLNKNIYVEAITFGLPLIGSELAFLLLFRSDRFLLAYYESETSVALYTVAFNMAIYFGQFIQAPIESAFTPMCTKLWNEHKKIETAELITNVLRYFIIICLPLITLCSVIRFELVIFLASEKYASSASILPILLIALTLLAAFHIVSVGLYLLKKTRIVLYFSWVGFAVNLVLNIILIPKFSHFGAAISCLTSISVLLALVAIQSRKLVPFNISINGVMIALLISTLIYVLIPLISISSPPLNIAASSLSAATIWIVILLVCDKQFRQLTHKTISRLLLAK